MQKDPKNQHFIKLGGRFIKIIIQNYIFYKLAIFKLKIN